MSLRNLSVKIKIPKLYRDKLKNRKKADLPYISRYQVEKMIKRAKKTKSGVPGDLPKKLVTIFLYKS